MSPEALDAALRLFELTPPVTRDAVELRRRELLAAWHPHRYANLTNNPRKYMQMYKKGEAMSKEVQAAYELLIRWIEEQST